jgi:hypothetical protein
VNEAISGAASGSLMGVVFLGMGWYLLVVLSKDPPSFLSSMLQYSSLGFGGMILSFIGLSVWGVIGLLIGILYGISLQVVPGPGLGSPNVVYTSGVVLVSVILVIPYLFLFRRVFFGVCVLAVAFMGIFGWFLPYFAA